MKIHLPYLFLFLLLPGFAHAQTAGILDEELDVEINELPQLNSSARETNISITPNGKTMFYMSDRGQMPWSQNYGTFQGRPRFDGDIWCSQKTGDTWGKPFALSPPVNTENGEDEPNVSPTGNRVFFQSWLDTWENDGGPYYSAQLTGTRWSRPQGLGGGINAFFKKEFEKYNTYATDGMSISPDGQRFIVAAGRDYDGNLDLYMSTKQGNGEWGMLKKLSISTPRDERSVFWGADGKTLFFSSSGYGGYGGLDILKTTINENGSFGPVVNLGPKFNSAKDDYGFIMAASGKEAYFVRDGDIYQAILKDPPEELLPSPTAMVYGEVKDDQGVMQKVKITLFDKKTNKEIMYTHTYATNGKYDIYLADASGDYYLRVEQSGELIEERDVEINRDELYNEIRMDFVIGTEVEEERHPIVDKRVFENVYFRSGSARIEMKGYVQLNNLVHYLKEHPDVYVLVTAFADEHGSNDYNKSLSERRAKAITDYLRSKGVPVDHMQVETFSKAQQETVHSDTELTRFVTNQVEISVYRRPGNDSGPNETVRAVPKPRAVIMPNDPAEEQEKTMEGESDVEEDFTEEAYPNLAEVLETVPENAAEYMERGFAHALDKQYDAAISDYSKALELDPNNAEVFHFRGMAKRDKGDYKGALDDYNTYLKLDPDHDVARFTRAQLYIKLKQKKKGCAELELLHQEYPDLVKPWREKYCQ